MDHDEVLKFQVRSSTIIRDISSALSKGGRKRDLTATTSDVAVDPYLIGWLCREVLPSKISEKGKRDEEEEHPMVGLIHLGSIRKS